MKRVIISLLIVLSLVVTVKATDCGDVNNPTFKISFTVNEGEKVSHELLIINEDGKDPCDIIPVITYLSPVPKILRMGTLTVSDPNRALSRFNWCANEQVNDVNQAIVLSQWIAIEPNFIDAGTYILPYKVSDKSNTATAVIEVRVVNVNRPPFVVAAD
jgi:hypothetical protein